MSCPNIKSFFLPSFSINTIVNNLAINNDKFAKLVKIVNSSSGTPDYVKI